MKDNVPIYHLIESLFKIIDFLVTFILLKSCDKIWLALDCTHHTNFHKVGLSGHEVMNIFCNNIKCILFNNFV